MGICVRSSGSSDGELRKSRPAHDSDLDLEPALSFREVPSHRARTLREPEHTPSVRFAPASGSGRDLARNRRERALELPLNAGLSATLAAGLSAALACGFEGGDITVS